MVTASPRSPTGDRAQLILVGAIVLAVAIVGLVVVLNTVLFTENVSNRVALESAGDAAELRETVRDDLPGLVRGANRNGTHATPAAARTAVNETVRRYGSLLAVSTGNRRPASVVVGVADRPSVSKAVVDSDSSRELTARSGASDWTVAADATVQHYRLTVDAAELAATDANAFRVNVSSGGSFWTLRLHRNGTAVDVDRAGTGVSGLDCTVSPTDGNVTLDLSNGMVADGACSVPFAEGVSAPYAISYRNATNATGTYLLVLDGTGATLGDVDAAGPWQSPRRDYVVDEATVALRYSTPELRYETTTNATIYP